LIMKYDLQILLVLTYDNLYIRLQGFVYN